MEEINQPVAAPEASVAEKPKKCKHIPIIIVLILLFSGSLAFGIIELALNLQKPADSGKTVANNSGKSADDGGYSGKIYGSPIVVKKDCEDNPNNSENNTEPNESREVYAIELWIDIDYDTTVIKECEDEICLEGIGYPNFTFGVDNFLVSYTGEKSVAYLAYDGWFGGTAPYGTNLKKNIVKEFKVSGKLKHIMKGFFGNGGSEAILMLKTDGTVAAIYLNEDATDFVLADKLSGIKNIEELREGYNQNGGDVFAIDKNGKAQSIGNVIWNWTED